MRMFYDMMIQLLQCKGVAKVFLIGCDWGGAGRGKVMKVNLSQDIFSCDLALKPQPTFPSHCGRAPKIPPPLQIILFTIKFVVWYNTTRRLHPYVPKPPCFNNHIFPNPNPNPTPTSTCKFSDIFRNM